MKDVWDKYDKICEDAYSTSRKETHIKYKDWLDSPWSGFFEGKDPLKASKSGVKEETLVHIGKRFSSPPPNAAEFVIHRGIKIKNFYILFIQNKCTELYILIKVINLKISLFLLN